jgi:hypothetical protein
MLDNQVGNPQLKATRKLQAQHPIEEGGRQAARDDAVDRQEQAGRQGEELTRSAAT